MDSGRHTEYDAVACCAWRLQLSLVSTICRGSLAITAPARLRPRAGAGTGVAARSGAALQVSIMTRPACCSDPEMSTWADFGAGGT